MNTQRLGSRRFRASNSLLAAHLVGGRWFRRDVVAAEWSVFDTGNELLQEIIASGGHEAGAGTLLHRSLATMRMGSIDVDGTPLKSLPSGRRLPRHQARRCCPIDPGFLFARSKDY